MRSFQILSALLQYPEKALLEALPEIHAELEHCSTEVRTSIAPLLAYLAQHDLIELQENYVATFDRNRTCSLHLFEHVYGESRERGPAMVSLMQEYTNHNFLVVADELPDFLPMFLEFLGQTDEATAAEFLGESIHVIARIGDKLDEGESPYHGVFTALRSLTDVEPLPLAEPPVRDMDEVMEQFGSGVDGIEPLLSPSLSHQATTQTIQFYPRTAAPVGASQGV
ncbi:nitrate reductase molybdenum cofactor assembly chaperone [Deefgea sp. CFH1-16]|uniref:nitrate reductase molybdenum cofactor assembly chaperone n=1 Tax=Deefgea sp. CFH1-16 TaxID=2675457 RepID=UPI0015F508C7|nr:nitrate reductase molybdenum cofactor assembly chaperone [Deefgea sp. CFH1-16]MBM5573385.1 nitrate reductase molybdenum cofactor assembly chaperone [Deefgea sp. CFH1-16]